MSSWIPEWALARHPIGEDATIENFPTSNAWPLLIDAFYSGAFLDAMVSKLQTRDDYSYPPEPSGLHGIMDKMLHGPCLVVRQFIELLEEYDNERIDIDNANGARYRGLIMGESGDPDFHILTCAPGEESKLGKPGDGALWQWKMRELQMKVESAEQGSDDRWHDELAIEAASHRLPDARNILTWKAMHIWFHHRDPRISPNAQQVINFPPDNIVGCNAYPCGQPTLLPYRTVANSIEKEIYLRESYAYYVTQSEEGGLIWRFFSTMTEREFMLTWEDAQVAARRKTTKFPGFGAFICFMWSDSLLERKKAQESFMFKFGPAMDALADKFIEWCDSDDPWLASHRERLDRSKRILAEESGVIWDDHVTMHPFEVASMSWAAQDAAQNRGEIFGCAHNEWAKYGDTKHPHELSDDAKRLRLAAIADRVVHGSCSFIEDIGDGLGPYEGL
jgi:hypothetical protein